MHSGWMAPRWTYLMPVGQGLTTVTDIGTFNNNMIEDACESLKLKVDALPLVVNPTTNKILQNFVPGML